MTEVAMKVDCRGCGSSLEYSAKDQSSKCPYCGIVTEIPSTEEELPGAPTAIFPLTIDLTKLTDAVYEHLASGDMTPDQLLEHATFTKKERFYAPAYGFRGDFVAKWTASFGYNRQEEYTAYETRTENGQSYRVPVTKTKTVTDWRPVSGTDTGEFAVLAYAGQQLLAATAGAVNLIENQPGHEAVTFNPSYTTGIPVETYAVSADDAYRDRGNSQVNKIIDHSVHQHAQGDRQKDWHWTTNINKTSSTILVPICHAIYEYQGTSYHVWIGGTNASQVVADILPVDANRQWAVKYGFLPIIVATIASSFAVFALGYNALVPIGVVLAAVLYGFLRRSAIIEHSRDIRQCLLANRRASATNTAALTAAEQEALCKETVQPGKPFLAYTVYDHILIPLIIMIVALIPFTERVLTPKTARNDGQLSVPGPAVVQDEEQRTTTVSRPVVAKREESSAVAALKIPDGSTIEQTETGRPPREPQISTPTPSTSGMLHYSGPPVGYGGTVVFSNLPGERLRFTFDQQSWQPLIAHLSDGTQKLTLLSLKKENQVQCDVHWEIVR
jgi:hypothetical protein